MLELRRFTANSTTSTEPNEFHKTGKLQMYCWQVRAGQSDLRATKQRTMKIYTNFVVCLLALGMFALVCPVRAEHSSISGTSLMPEDVYSNMHALRGQIVKIRFTPRGQIKQVSPEYYEVRVLPRDSDAVVLVPVEVGAKWFAPNATRKPPKILLVKVDIGEIENEYGVKKQGLIMKAVGTRTRRGLSYDDVVYEW